MVSKRVMVIAAEKALQKRLAAGVMAAGGAVQTYATVEEAAGRIETDLVLVALPAREPGAPAGPPPSLASLAARLPEGAHLLPLVPATDLEQSVALLADPRVPCVLVADGLTRAAVTAATAKLLGRDLFGVEKVMPWGVRVYSALVSDYNEKSAAIAAVGDFAQAMGVRRKYREQIDQCVDEMLMNALYDAPVDAAGKPLFSEVPVRERVLMRVDEKAVLQYACDGERFAVSVRDSFGTLRRETILAYLDKCLHATENQVEQIDRKASGAGLGLYLIANAATEVYFHIFSGSASEVVCAFDLTAPRAQLRALGIFEEQIEGAARAPGPLTTVSTRRGRRREDLVPAPPARAGAMLPTMLAFAMLLFGVAATLMALPYLRRPAAAYLRIETDPPGATVYVDGRARGAGPLKLDAEAGRSYALRATLDGWRDDEQLVTAAAGDSTVRLRLGAEHAVAAIESDPAGARLFLDGKDAGKLTPTQLELHPGEKVEAVLKKQGFVDQPLTIVAPRTGERTVYRASLPLAPTAALLTIQVQPPNANVSVDGLTLAPPAPSHDTFVAPGRRHRIRASAVGFADLRQEVFVAGGEHRTLQLTLPEGGTLALRVNVPARVVIDGKPVGTAPLAPLGLLPGPHTLGLAREDPPLDWSTPITIEKGRTLDVELQLADDHGVTGHIGDKTVTGKW